MHPVVRPQKAEKDAFLFALNFEPLFVNCNSLCKQFSRFLHD